VLLLKNITSAQRMHAGVPQLRRIHRQENPSSIESQSSLQIYVNARPSSQTAGSAHAQG
jgi:hypothetical protein